MRHEQQCAPSELHLDPTKEEFVSELFKMLGDPGRLRIVCALMGTQMCVAHLAQMVEMEQSALSHQLKNLRQTGIVKSERNGKQVFYSLDDEHIFNIIKQAIDHINHTKGAK